MLLFDLFRRFILTGFNTHVKIGPSLSVMDYVLNWEGRSAEEFSRHLHTIQRMLSGLTLEVKLAINYHMVHDLIRSSLESHSDLSGIHTLLSAN